MFDLSQVGYPNQYTLLRRHPLAADLRPLRPAAVPAGETGALPEVRVSDGRVGRLHGVRRGAGQACGGLNDRPLRGRLRNRQGRSILIVQFPDCPTDINADGSTNVLDLIDLLLCFAQPAAGGCEAEDINEDLTVNVLDLIDLLLAFGTACP